MNIGLISLGELALRVDNVRVSHQTGIFIRKKFFLGHRSKQDEKCFQSFYIVYESLIQSKVSPTFFLIRIADFRGLQLEMAKCFSVEV